MGGFSGPTRREILLTTFLSVSFLLIMGGHVISSDDPRGGGRSVFGVSIPSSFPGGGGGSGSCYDDDLGDATENGSRGRIRNGEQMRLNGASAWDDDALENGWTGGPRSGARPLVMNDTLSRWAGEGPPRTEIQAHAPGWTIYKNLYLLNGTWYIVTDNPSDIPLLRLMTSTGAEIWNDEESIASREPTDKDMKIIFPSEAQRLFGHTASKVDGTTWLNNDPPQFLDHYYHFAAELLFGMWRTYAHLDPDIPSTGVTRLPAPKRFAFSRTDYLKWRDYSSMNTFLLKSVFPSMSYEFSEEWKDRTNAGRAFVYDQIVFSDRAAALRGPQFAHTWRTAAEAFTLEGSAYWWSPVRKNLLEFVGVPDSTLNPVEVGVPVITYVSRQDWGRRMLIQADHEKLVKELNALHEKYGYEVNIVAMDKLSRDEQIRLAARTTIMLGVHGNGLTHLLWMKPTPRATVIEFFFPQGFAHDYEFTSRALGISHYGFWGSEYFSAPDTPDVAYPDGFQGNAIPINGKVVADLIHARLSIPLETDESALTEYLEEEEATLEEDERSPAQVAAAAELEAEAQAEAEGWESEIGNVAAVKIPALESLDV